MRVDVAQHRIALEERGDAVPGARHRKSCIDRVAEIAGVADLVPGRERRLMAGGEGGEHCVRIGETHAVLHQRRERRRVLLIDHTGPQAVCHEQDHVVRLFLGEARHRHDGRAQRAGQRQSQSKPSIAHHPLRVLVLQRVQDVCADVGRSCDSLMTAARLEAWKVTTGCLTAQTCRIAERAAQRTLTRSRNFKLRLPLVFISGSVPARTRLVASLYIGKPSRWSVGVVWTYAPLWQSNMSSGPRQLLPSPVVTQSPLASSAISLISRKNLSACSSRVRAYISRNTL